MDVKKCLKTLKKAKLCLKHQNILEGETEEETQEKHQT